MGQNTFRTAYTMKDGTVVNEQAAFQGYIRNGGGFVAIHGANDSMGNWPFYLDMLGGVFRQHPGNAGGFGTDCGSCYSAELITEDDSHPATAGAAGALPGRWTSCTRTTASRARTCTRCCCSTTPPTDGHRRHLGAGASRARGPPDHVLHQLRGRPHVRPGARPQLGAVRQHAVVPQTILQGILTTAGLKPANCVTHREVRELIAGAADRRRPDRRRRDRGDEPRSTRRTTSTRR